MIAEPQLTNENKTNVPFSFFNNRSTDHKGDKYVAKETRELEGERRYNAVVIDYPSSGVFLFDLLMMSIADKVGPKEV